MQESPSVCIHGHCCSDFIFQDDKVEVLNWKRVSDEGTDNPAFNHIEMNFTDNKEKVNGVHK